LKCSGNCLATIGPIPASRFYLPRVGSKFINSMPNWRSQTCLPMDPLDLEKVVPEVTCHCIRIVFVSKTLDRPAEKRRDPASGRVLEFRVIENIEEFGAER
jgi:hypothetical protein